MEIHFFLLREWREVTRRRILSPLRGVCGVRRSPSPGCPSLERLGQVAVARCPCLLGAGGAVMRARHRSHGARSCELALHAVEVAGGHPRGGGGGGASCLCEGRLGLGAHPPPAACPWARQSGPAAHMLWVRVRRRWDPALALSQACPAGRCVPRG